MPSLTKSYFLKGSIGLMGVKVISVVAGLTVSAILARWLGPDEFGRFAFGVSVATLLALPLTGGLPTLLIREIAAARAQADLGKAKGVILWGLRVLFAACGALLVLFLVGYAVGVQMGLLSWEGPPFSYALMTALLIPALSLLHLQRSILAGHSFVVLGSLGEQVFRPVAMIILLVLPLQFLMGLGTEALAMMFLAVLVAVGLNLIVAYRQLPNYRSSQSTYSSKEWFLALLPLTAITATTVVKNNSDILMLGIMKEPAEVGVYRIAAQISVMSAVLMQILRSLGAPRIAAAHARQDMHSLRKQMILASRAMLIAACCFVVVFYAFGLELITLVFGDAYAAAFWPCFILALGTVFSAGTGLVGVALQVTKNANYAARAAVVAAIANILLNLVLIPPYGATGAAIATSISLVLMQSQLWLVARRVLGMRTDAFQSSGI